MMMMMMMVMMMIGVEIGMNDDDDDDDDNIKVMAKMLINVMMAKMMTMTNLIHVKSEVLETMM